MGEFIEVFEISTLLIWPWLNSLERISAETLDENLFPKTSLPNWSEDA